MRKPLIAITTNYSSEDIGTLTHAGTTEQKWNFIATDYVYAVEKAGGIPVLVPNYLNAETAQEIISHCDGLLLSGGSDIAPLLYGENMTEECGNIDPKRDSTEAVLAKTALQNKDFPVLGICRGCQLLNIVTGGTLNQDIKNHMFMSVPLNGTAHTVNLSENSLLSALSSKNSSNINSYHHQSIEKVSEKCKVIATAYDDTIEAIEYKEHKFVLGVQWHPEMLSEDILSQDIFKAFINACKK